MRVLEGSFFVNEIADTHFLAEMQKGSEGTHVCQWTRWLRWISGCVSWWSGVGEVPAIDPVSLGSMWPC